jgi:hypothetical protein
MSLLLKEELKTLVAEHPGPCVSIYMPTHRSGEDTRQDPIRFKNLLRKAEEQLVQGGLRKVDTRTLLEPAQELQGYSPFWRHLGDGLAYFIAQDVNRAYTPPHRFDELLVVGDQFYVKPLLPLLSGDGRFYILALSQNQVRLLEGTREGASEVQLEELPGSLFDVLGDVEREKQLQFHTRTAGRQGGRNAIFFGHGGGENQPKEDLLRYFRQIDASLRTLWQNEQVPLVIAGVDYLLPLYQEASRYPLLMKKGISGNPEELSAHELHGRAWEIVGPFFLEEQQAAWGRFEQLQGSPQASQQIEEIVPAAYHGRVESLFVELGLQVWGRFEPETNEVHIVDQAGEGNEDLLQFTSIHTLANRGEVYTTGPGEKDQVNPLAAIFRYG